MANVKVGCNIKITKVQDRKQTGRKPWEAGHRTAFNHSIQCFDVGTKSGKAGRRQSKSAVASTRTNSKASRTSSPEIQERMKTID